LPKVRSVHVPLRGSLAKFTEGFADKLEVPAGTKDVQVFDDELPGFGIRKFRKGGKDGTPIDEPCRSGPSSFFVKFNVGKRNGARRWAGS